MPRPCRDDFPLVCATVVLNGRVFDLTQHLKITRLLDQDSMYSRLLRVATTASPSSMRFIRFAGGVPSAP